MQVTQKELVRSNTTLEQITKLYKDGYKLKEVTISMDTATIMGVIYGLVLSIPFVLAYYFKFGYLFGGPEATIWEKILIFGVLTISIVVHEAIHALCMYCFNGRNKSLIEFGMIKGNPYCTCQSPINKTQYLIFALMPTLILGTIFTILALSIGKFFWLLLVIVTLAGAGGDFTIIFNLLRLKGKNVKIVDHPYKCGFFALSKDYEEDMYADVINEIDALEVKEK